MSVKLSLIFSVRKPRYVRVNNLLWPLNKAVAYFQEEGWSLLPKCSTYAAHLAAVKNLSQPKFMQDFHIPELLVFPPDTTFHDHLGYKNGEIVLQDKVSVFGMHKLALHLFNFVYSFLFFVPLGKLFPSTVIESRTRSYGARYVCSSRDEIISFSCIDEESRVRSLYLMSTISLIDSYRKIGKYRVTFVGKFTQWKLRSEDTRSCASK